VAQAKTLPSTSKVLCTITAAPYIMGVDLHISAHHIDELLQIISSCTTDHTWTCLFMSSPLFLSCPAGVVAAGAVSRPLSNPHRFRFWIDYQAFSSPESAALPEAALVALGGVKTGGPPKLDPITAVKQKIRDYGYMHMDKWEVLLSITAKAMLAAEVRTTARPTQEPTNSQSSCPDSERTDSA